MDPHGQPVDQRPEHDPPILWVGPSVDGDRGPVVGRGKQIRRGVERKPAHDASVDCRLAALAQRATAMRRVDRLPVLAPQHGRRLDQQQARSPVLLHGCEVGLAPGGQGLKGRQAGRRGLLDLVGDRARLRLDDGAEQGLLVGEGVVQGTPRHPRGGYQIGRPGSGGGGRSDGLGDMSLECMDPLSAAISGPGRLP
jgi:hypothetical protein